MEGVGINIPECFATNSNLIIETRRPTTTNRKHVARHQKVSETLSGTMDSLEKYSDSFEQLMEEMREMAFANSVGQNTITNLHNAIQNKRDSGDMLKFAAKATT